MTQTLHPSPTIVVLFFVTSMGHLILIPSPTPNIRSTLPNSPPRDGCNLFFVPLSFPFLLPPSSWNALLLWSSSMSRYTGDQDTEREPGQAYGCTRWTDYLFSTHVARAGGESLLVFFFPRCHRLSVSLPLLSPPPHFCCVCSIGWCG
ncbi:hypothetical protein F5I97DRAFT_1509939 [Phlebopus sp. FC_14]|nr:hypothetical protein F5I97DRAFT_1509939 [Phlebopus sp. FC_14]